MYVHRETPTNGLSFSCILPSFFAILSLSNIRPFLVSRIAIVTAATV